VAKPKKKKSNKKKLKKSISSFGRKENSRNKNSYENSVLALKRLFSQYGCEDVILSIITSEIWLPNVASCVKHQLCLGVISSMTSGEFTGKHQIDNYSKLVSFLKTTYSLLPSFPMLEDFTPQADWGEIHVIYNQKNWPVFFGGGVERITDFIKAFEIRYASNTDAIMSMELAIMTQSKIISSVNREIVGNTSNISAGAVSLPSETFWIKIKSAIKDFNNEQRLNKYTAINSIELGSFILPESESDFSNLLMEGEFQKHLFIRHNDQVYPASIRNFTSTVMDYWSDKEDVEDSKYASTRALSSFINVNVSTNVPGPSIIKDQSFTLDLLYPSLIISKDILFIPIPVFRKDLEGIAFLVEEFKKYVTDLEQIDIFNLNFNHAIRLSSEFSFEQNNIKILIILMDVSTGPSFIDAPPEPAYLTSLADFVTLISSMDKDDSLEEIFNFRNGGTEFGPMAGLIDQLAAYKDSDSVLVEGANTPNILMIDPHYGCEWRYKKLLEFWQTAPQYFSNMKFSWRMGSSYDGISNMFSESPIINSWFTKVGRCEIHFSYTYSSKELTLNNVRILSLAIECFADAFQQRADIISDLPIFDKKALFFNCNADLDFLVDHQVEITEQEVLNKPIVTKWSISERVNDNIVQINTALNLKVVSKALTDAVDASFQSRCVNDFIYYISKHERVKLSKAVLNEIDETSSRPPRMLINIVQQSISVPEVSSYKKTQPKHYKLARKELAMIMKKLGIEPGQYELSEAKRVIDQARNVFRDSLHEHLSTFDRTQLLKFCVEQHDSLSSRHRSDEMRIQQSLKHEVSFDRASQYSSDSQEFIKSSINYRYIIECFVSQGKFGSDSISLEEILTLTGKVDWLMVLYNASDILHNDIDVGGIRINEDYIPEVFYSDERYVLEEEFKKRDANLKLGKNINHTDKLIVNFQDLLPEVHSAFEAEYGFTFSLMLEVLEGMYKWTTIEPERELDFHYVDNKFHVAEIIAKSLNETNMEAVHSALDFLTINPQNIRRLTGKDMIESDVPVWEHIKRSQRYTIRPIIALNNEDILWGADAANKAHTIWLNSILDGYLPADLNSKAIDSSIRNIKQSLEKQLEVVAVDIVSRFSCHYIHGIDFKRRFQKYGFADVGDYDVLAYWPDKNLWLTIECKYMQPPFCIKDSRRVRDRMFEPSKGKSHLCKIRKRRDFLMTNVELMRTLLKWPAPSISNDIDIKELYVSRYTYWWMFAPPYPVPTEFVQIDLLEAWIIANC
jgi:hypothetical protein